MRPRRPQIAPRSPAAAPSRFPMNPLGPAAAKPSADWGAHHAGVPHRRHSPRVPDFPRQFEASQAPSNADAAPDPTKPKPCSRSLIRLQINQQTIAAKMVDRKAVLTGELLGSGVMPSLGYRGCQYIRPARGLRCEFVYLGINPWCPWPESNQHSLRNSILSRARLPIPPQGPFAAPGWPGSRSRRNIAAAPGRSTRGVWGPVRSAARPRRRAAIAESHHTPL